jgi:hypothetical protein
MASFLDPNDPRIQGAGAMTDAGDWFSQQGAPTGGGYTGPDIAGGGYTGGAAPPGGQNYQQIVESLMGGSNDPETLRQIAPQLAQYGITLSNPNASGDLSKIILPDGTPIRVIGAGEGHAVWNPQPGNWGPGGVPQGGQSGTGMSPLGALAGGLDPSAAGRLGYSGGLGLNVDVTQDPSYQFRVQQGQQALERSAAAKGTLLTGGTAKALARYGQDLASTEYGNVYNRALGENTAAYGRLFGEQQNRNNQLMSLANLGATAASAQGNLGSTYAGQAGTLLGSQATNIGNNLTGAGNANAASTLAQGNAWNQGLQGVGQGANNALQMYYLSRLYGGGGAGTIPDPGVGYGVTAPAGTSPTAAQALAQYR